MYCFPTPFIFFLPKMRNYTIVARLTYDNQFEMI